MGSIKFGDFFLVSEELTAFQDGPRSLDLFIYLFAVVTATSTKSVIQCMNLYQNFLSEQSHYQPLCMA